MNVKEELAAMEHMTTGELAERYAELFGQQVRTRHRAYLVRKVAWRLQALAEGGLCERARRRAMELANDADVRLMPPRPNSSVSLRLAKPRRETRASNDQRLPAPGTAIIKRYKGRKIDVLVLANGFEYEGRLYKTLTAVAGAVTGTHCNGFRFFGLGVSK
jgi:hypothetical protein